MGAAERRTWKLQLSEAVILVSLGIVAIFVPFRLEFCILCLAFFIAGVAG
jgi:uncharacterized membrane protein HdeD (DUF308 family)